MNKQEKELKKKKSKRLQKGLAIVMILFTVLPMGFSVYQGVSSMKASEQYAMEQAEVMQEVSESEPAKQSIMYQDNQDMAEMQEAE